MILVYGLLLGIFLIWIFHFASGLGKFVTHWWFLKRIPAPPGHWLFGQLSWDILKDHDLVFPLLRKYAKDYWPIYRAGTLGVTVVNLLHPKDIEMVISNTRQITKSKIYDKLQSLLDTGLLNSTGEKWHSRRKLLTPAFHFNILKEFLLVFNEEAEKLVRKIEENCDQPYIDFLPLITDMAFQTISETAMGIGQFDPVKQSNYKNSLVKLMKLAVTKILTPWYSIPIIYRFSKVRKAEAKLVDYLHNFSYEVIQSREQELLKQYEKKDTENTTQTKRKSTRMLDLLLMSKINNHDIDLEGIREEVDTFMAAGHETSSTGITFLLCILANHQDIQKLVRQEMNDVIGANVPTYAHLQELKYTDRVIKEMLRLYPPVPIISRVASEDFTTATGYYIPKETILIIHIYDVHRDPRIYPDPLNFDPDRFLPENCVRHPHAYLPFSAGPRNCIGQKYATLQMKAVLCHILRRFTLHPVDRLNDITFSTDIVLRPAMPVRVKFVAN